MGGADTGAAVLDGFVRNAKLAKVMANHLGLRALDKGRRNGRRW